ncbi:MAG TPA: HAD-IA family hydrolase [Planctomycetota bacterium]
MTRAVFFDAGHTLLYAHPDLPTIYTEVSAAFGARLEPAAFAAAFGPAFKAGVKESAPDGRASDAQDLAMWRGITRRIHEAVAVPVAFDVWFDALWAHFGSAACWRFYDDVAATLGALRARGLKLGVVSNWDSRLRRIADGMGLTALVDFLVISAEAGVRKPDPGIFRLACEKAGVQPEEALHVGDLAEEDVLGAQRAGVRAVLIERSKRMVDPAAIPDVPILKSLREIEDLV